MMADAVSSDSLSSVYVLDFHCQDEESRAMDVFASESGRTLSNTSFPDHRKSNRSGYGDLSALLLHDEMAEGSRFEGSVIVHEENESKKSKAVRYWKDKRRGDEKDQHDQFTTDENRNVMPNVQLTRRLISFKNGSFDDRIEEGCFASDDHNQNNLDEDTTRIEICDDDARIEEKILRLKRHYERGFAADEKCDILKKMLTGFLSGIMSTKKALKWKKRKANDDLYKEASLVLGIPCEMTDSCRCIECQCNYFDCGDDSDSEPCVDFDEADVEQWYCEDNAQDKAVDEVHYENERPSQSEKQWWQASSCESPTPSWAPSTSATDPPDQDEPSSCALQ